MSCSASYAEAIAASINVVITCYPALLDNTLGALLCEQFSDGERYVRADVTFKCDTGKWTALVVLAGFVILGRRRRGWGRSGVDSSPTRGCR